MPNVIVVGTQWGDEGKGKIIDLLTPSVDVVVRFRQEGAVPKDLPDRIAAACLRLVEDALVEDAS